MKNWSKTTIKITYWMTMLALMGWFLTSWIEIATHNDISGYVYSATNLFVIFF